MEREIVTIGTLREDEVKVAIKEYLVYRYELNSLDIKDITLDCMVDIQHLPYDFIATVSSITKDKIKTKSNAFRD